MDRPPHCRTSPGPETAKVKQGRAVKGAMAARKSSDEVREVELRGQESPHVEKRTNLHVIRIPSEHSVSKGVWPQEIEGP